MCTNININIYIYIININNILLYIYIAMPLVSSPYFVPMACKEQTEVDHAQRLCWRKRRTVDTVSCQKMVRYITHITHHIYNPTRFTHGLRSTNYRRALWGMVDIRPRLASIKYCHQQFPNTEWAPPWSLRYVWLPLTQAEVWKCISPSTPWWKEGIRRK